MNMMTTHTRAPTRLDHLLYRWKEGRKPAINSQIRLQFNVNPLRAVMRIRQPPELATVVCVPHIFQGISMSIPLLSFPSLLSSSGSVWVCLSSCGHRQQAMTTDNTYLTSNKRSGQKKKKMCVSYYSSATWLACGMCVNAEPVSRTETYVRS